MNLGNSLFHARKRRGLSQEDVAEKLGVSRQTISKWETGETIPDIRQCKRLAVLYQMSLDELIEIGERYNKNVATLAVAMRSCTHPQNGGTITNLPDGIMEIGMGQHGEGGGGQKPLVSADDTAAEMVDLLCQQLQPKAGDKMLLIINGVGATTHMELNIIFRKAYKELEARGLQVVASRIQEILTVQEQAGFQMIMAILDEDHIDYLNNKRADAPYWTTLGK